MIEINEKMEKCDIRTVNIRKTTLDIVENYNIKIIDVKKYIYSYRFNKSEIYYVVYPLKRERW